MLSLCIERVRKIVFESNSAKETFEIAKKIGQKAQAGEIYCLSGDLGVGKTVFSQGFANGLGVLEQVNSPTFTILQIYNSGRLQLYHFDVYRLGDLAEMDDIGYDDYFFGEGVCLIEWSNLIKELLPTQRINIKIEKALNQSFDYRKITVI